MRPGPIPSTLLLVLAACGPAEQARNLRLVRIEPQAGPLFLNQRIVLVFDRPIDPSSITEDTFEVLDEVGHRVPGRLRSGGFTATFVPLAPRSPSLSDGSFQPARRYRLRLRTFPRADSIRGAAGELLFEAESRTWRAVSPEDLPPGAPSVLLPEGRGSFRLHGVRPVDAGGGIELSLGRPVHPASLRPEAFRLLRRAGAIEIAIRSVRILDRDGPGGPGSVVRLEPAFRLSPGLYSLLFEAGSKGLYDPSLAPLEIPTGIASLPWQNGGSIEFVVDPEDRAWPFLEDFDGPAFAGEPERLGLFVPLQGALATGPEGLRWPDLALEGFDSLGPFEPEGAGRLLGADRPLQGHSDHPLGTRWDFDSFHVPRGCRVVILLDRPLELRIAGSLVVDGELLFRLGGKLRPRPGRPRPVADGTPAGEDGEVGPGITLRVGGLCRLGGRIDFDTPTEGLVPGHLSGDGPFFGPWGTMSMLPAWRRPRPPEDDGEPLHPRLLPGQWGFVGDWHRLDPARRLRGEVELRGTLDEGLCELRVQAERVDTGPTAWVRPDLLPSLGRVRRLRVALWVDGRLAERGPFLRSLAIR